MNAKSTSFCFLDSTEISSGELKVYAPIHENSLYKDLSSSSFLEVLPDDINIFTNIKTFDDVPDTINRMILTFKTLLSIELIRLYKDGLLNTKLEKVKCNKVEENAVLLEWDYQNTQIGFAFENEIEESSLYIVHNNTTEGKYISYSQKINSTNLDEAVKLTANFVVSKLT